MEEHASTGVEQLHPGGVRCEIFVSQTLIDEKRVPHLKNRLFNWETEESENSRCI